jgi:hypothetical protein
MSMIDTAEAISRWPGLGIKLPEALSTAIEVFEALRWIEVGREPVFQIAEVTPKNAEAKIRELADQLVLSEIPGGGLSVLGKAKKKALEAAALQVFYMANSGVKPAIEQMTPEFDKHAEAYTAAVAQLPDEITAESLLSAGTDAVAAYGVAQHEAAYLNRISKWVSSTAQLSMHSGDQDPALRILRPTSVTQLFKLDEAQAKPAIPALHAIDPLLFTAARLEVPFAINTIRGCAAIRTELTTVRQPVSFG